MKVRVIALGSEMARDDGAALAAAARLGADPDVEVLMAGRPGAGLLDMLDPSVPTLLLDVVRRGAPPGELVELSLDRLRAATVDGQPLSSHGLGVAQAFRLAEALGRTLPPGRFVGIGGRSFHPGQELSAEVAAGIGRLVVAAELAIDGLKGG